MAEHGHRAGPGRAGYVLRPDEVEQVARTVAALRARTPVTDGADAVNLARLLNGWAPEGLLQALEDFRRFGNDRGVLTIGNLPVPADLPATPCVPNSVARECTQSAALLLLLMSRLGDPISYAEEKHGALIHDICPVPGEEDQQQNTGAAYFKLHTENAFHAGRPDFLGLLCLRPDHDLAAKSITSSVREAVAHLAPEHLQTLRQPRFRTRLAPSFCRGVDARPYLPPAAIISGSREFPVVTVDFDDTMPCDAIAEKAFDALHAALQAVRCESVLYPGDLAIIDNSTTVHGRTAFTPRYDGNDRWLQRMFVVKSLRNVLEMLDAGDIHRCRAMTVPGWT